MRYMKNKSLRHKSGNQHPVKTWYEQIPWLKKNHYILVGSPLFSSLSSKFENAEKEKCSILKNTPNENIYSLG